MITDYILLFFSFLAAILLAVIFVRDWWQKRKMREWEPIWEKFYAERMSEAGTREGRAGAKGLE